MTALMKAQQLMMLVHGPPLQFYMMNRARLLPTDKLEATPYVQLFKHMVGNSWDKLLGLHMLITLKRPNLCHFSAIIQGDIGGNPLTCQSEPLFLRSYNAFICRSLLEKTFKIEKQSSSFMWLRALL